MSSDAGLAFDESDLSLPPIRQLQKWLSEAEAAALPEPNAMTLATVAVDGTPRVRVVLLRGADETGLSFFTNYESDKARQLLAHPQASLGFLWLPFARQVRVEGVVEQVPVQESDDYWASRPRGHQLAAWASDQSRVAPSRRALQDRFAAMTQRFANHDVPRPAHWGGFRLKPAVFEFWQGRENRLHDRLRCTLGPEGWQVERLWP